MANSHYKTDEYYRNLEAIQNRFPNRRLLTRRDVCEFLGVGDNRRLERLYGITGSITAESLAVKLSK